MLLGPYGSGKEQVVRWALDYLNGNQQGSLNYCNINLRHLDPNPKSYDEFFVPWKTRERVMNKFNKLIKANPDRIIFYSDIQEMLKSENNMWLLHMLQQVIEGRKVVATGNFFTGFDLIMDRFKVMRM